MKLLLHPDTNKNLHHLLAYPPHAVLVVAPKGAGKATLAEYIASQLLNVAPDELSRYPYYQAIGNGEEPVTIDDIRKLHAQTRLKTTGQTAVRRLLVIFGADNMTKEAQNALLKLLEEPPADTVLLLTCARPASLLPTIRSRTQAFTLKPPTMKITTEYFQSQGYSDKDIQAAYFLSEGGIGLMTALLGHEDDHPLAKAVQEAKQLLKQGRYNKLVTVEKLVRDKGIDITVILDALGRVCRTLMHESAKKNDKIRAQHWQKLLKEIMQAQTYINANVSSKLVMADLVLHM